MRAAVIDFELLSHLHFTSHSERFSYKHQGKNVSRTPSEKSVTVWQFHVQTTTTDPSPKAKSSRIATLIRPPAETFKGQLDFLDQYSDLREDRVSEIVTQLGPQYAFWSSVVNLHPDRTKKTIELLDAALRFATAVEMRIKHALACWRPYELSSQVQPIILTPGHGTFPSGHSTENHMIARILWELYGREPKLGEQLMRQAARIAVNRTVAGVHFPVDTAAGQVLGLSLARYFILRAKGGPRFNAWRFDGGRYGATQDFNFHDFYNPANGQEKLSPLIDPPYVDFLASTPPVVSPIMKWLWDAALAEVK
ncbi:phosphatase PAP2 family protein [Tardiphaga sp. OK246]|uniref:phosphatase PAP2 family protein n=1 Tax=Tardiphaga sp. OK246 TaxID=1855307 RepID=UPI001AEF4168|nr:phosphatase PAP2 family protein [Tardiphaga sp. OK246]